MKSHDEHKESKFITHFDANNLYSLAMSQYSHYSEFKWLHRE